MSHTALLIDLQHRFGISAEQAEKMIGEADAKKAIKQAVATASKGVLAKPNSDFRSPGAWRHEVHKRLAALDVMEEGVGCLTELLKHLKNVIEAEQKLIQHKRAKANNKEIDWWDFRESGWAMGGRERFATYVGDIFRNLDEGKLGGRVVDRLGFKRSIPLPDLGEPVEDVPRDDVELEQALVAGAKKSRKGGAA
jgi:hypothetical protein